MEKEVRGPTASNALGGPASSVPPLPPPDEVRRLREGEDAEKIVLELLGAIRDEQAKAMDALDAAVAEVVDDEAMDVRDAALAAVGGHIQALHDEARHAGPVRFCLDPVCDAWVRLYREEGWENPWS